MEDIKSQLDAIEWDQSSMTSNEYILKQVVESLLLLVAEESKEISELRQKLVQMKQQNAEANHSQSQSSLSAEFNEFDPENIKQQLLKIKAMIKQLKEERENADRTSKETIETITQENFTLKKELSELYAKYSKPNLSSSFSQSPQKSSSSRLTLSRSPK